MTDTDQTPIPIYPTSVTPGWEGYVGYPKSDSYTWGEFAHTAIEMGGYCDITAVNPYTGARLWVGEVYRDAPDPYTALRRLVDAMEATGFLNGDAPDPYGLRRDAERGMSEEEHAQIAGYKTGLQKRQTQERLELLRRHAEERAGILGEIYGRPGGLPEPTAAEVAAEKRQADV